jgi:hypothetical protein
MIVNQGGWITMEGRRDDKNMIGKTEDAAR